MEENQSIPSSNPAAGATVSPAVVSPPDSAAPTGAAALRPDPSLQPPTVNVSPTVQASTFSPADPVPPRPPTPADKEWSPSKKPAFTDPRSVLLFSLLGVVATVLFLTFGITVGIWIKLIVLLLLSLGGLVFAMRAYETDNSTLILLGFIISTIIFIGTIVIGSTYVYYTYKFKQVTNSFQSSY